MAYIDLLLTFAVVHLLAAASPGPNLIIVSSYAASRSRKAGFLAGLGIFLGTLTWASATALGLGAVVAGFPALYAAVQYAGAAYLIWLGVTMMLRALRDRYGDAAVATPKRESAHAILLQGYLVNMTNPKTIAYYTSLFAVLIPAGSPGWVFGAAVGVALSVTLVWWSFVALVFSTGAVRRSFAVARRYLDLIMGGALIYLGLRLAVNR